MKRWAVLLFCVCRYSLAAYSTGTQDSSVAPAHVSVTSLLQIRRIYVDQLTGGDGSFALRDLLISSINSTGLFVLTDNPDHADAVLKGAADDQTFENTFDASDSVSSHGSGGRSGGSTSGSISSRAGGLLGASSGAQSESRHIKERKHEAFAALRLCTRDGDVLWSTTQESLGSKFKGASADVAAKVARQLTLDYDRVKRQPVAPALPPAPR